MEQSGGDVDGRWYQHTGSTSRVAEKYWEIIGRAGSLTRPPGQYAGKFNAQYAGDRSDLYFS